MTRISLTLALLLCCLALAMQGSLRAYDTSASTGSGQNHSYASTDDWELPTFVAQPAAGTADRASNQMASEREVSVASKNTEIVLPGATPSHPASKSLASAASAASNHPLYDSKHHRVDPTTVATTADSGRHAPSSPLSRSPSQARDGFGGASRSLAGRLARLTAYWAGEGDYYTGRCVSATGIRLHGGHCAVDPSIIPYGSVVEIPGVGQFLAVDTGSAVIARTAAREAGHTRLERSALVIDLFFEHRREGEAFAANGPKFVPVSWWTPSSNNHAAREARSLFADEDWNKIYSKQL